jgi:hypothetical protein
MAKCPALPHCRARISAHAAAIRRYNDGAEGLAMWTRRLAFPSFVFFMVGFMFVMLGWACGMFRNLFLW